MASKKVEAEKPRFSQHPRWKGKRLLTAEEKRARRRVTSAKWRAANAERLREYFRAYAKAHPELKAYLASYYRKNKPKWDAIAKSPKYKAWAKAYRQRTKAQRNAARRAWDRKNPDRAKAIATKSRERNRDAKRAADRAYRQEKPETYKASIAKAKAAKPELYRTIQAQSAQRRRARQRALPVEPVSHKRLRERDGMRCHLCLQQIDNRVTFDHLIPIVRGGAHAEWNLMLAHDRCNKKRGTRALFPVETREACERYIAARLEAK